jgi:branched-chain amino acid transport system permease protein
MLPSVILNGFIEGLLIALVSLAFQLSYRGLRLFDIGMGGFYVLSAYIYLAVANLCKGHFSHIIVVIISLMATIIFTTVLMSLTQHFVYRFFINKKTSETTMMIVSLSLYYIFVNLILLFTDTGRKNIDLGLSNYGSFLFLGINISIIQIVQLFISLLLLLIVITILTKSTLGLRITALSENIQLFRLLGFNLFITYQHIIVICGVLVSVASVLKTADIGIEPFTTGFHIILLSAISVIIGGSNSYIGAIIGSLTLAIFMNLSSWYFQGQWKDVFVFILLLIVLFTKRKGLFHTQIREEK